MRLVIAADIGRSATKVVARLGVARYEFIFPSVAIPAFSISDPVEARRAEMETVELATPSGRQKWFVGETALTQAAGTLQNTGLSNDFIRTPEHAALFMGAIKKLQQSGVTTDGALVIVGLPSALHAEQKDELREIIRNLHPCEVLVAPQPIGPINALMFDHSGNEKRERSIADESWASIDIGFKTTDTLLMQRGRWVEKASGSTDGVYVAAEHMQRLLKEQGISADLLECEQAIRDRRIKHFGKTIDLTAQAREASRLLVANITDHVMRLIAPVAARLDGVILAGGGAIIAYEELAKHWPHTVMAEDSRMSIAEGFGRFGLAFLKAKANG